MRAGRRRIMRVMERPHRRAGVGPADMDKLLKVLSALLALTVLTGAAASASAFDAKTFYQDQDRSRY